MSGGFVKVIAYWDNHLNRYESINENEDHFYPIKAITHIIRVKDLIWMNAMEAKVQTYLNDTKPPFYIIRIKAGDLIIDPNCKEQMIRILAGKDTAMYDLVDELRYNPNIGLQVRAAKHSFENNIK